MPKPKLIDLLEPCSETLCKELSDGRSISMTDATEVIFGTSGRGSRKAVLLIEEMARRGSIAIDTSGRTRQVRLPSGTIHSEEENQ